MTVSLWPPSAPKVTTETRSSKGGPASGVQVVVKQLLAFHAYRDALVDVAVAGGTPDAVVPGQGVDGGVGAKPA